MLKEWIHINYVIHNRLKNSIEQFKDKILKSITPEELHLAGKTHENSYKKSFDLRKRRHIQKFNELIGKNKITQSATNIRNKNKWVINMSSRQLTHTSSNINGVIKEEFQAFLFFYEKIYTHKKAYNANKRLSLRYLYTLKKDNKQTSDFHS